MACKKSHEQSDKIIAKLPINQGGLGRHKCASCAYEKGLENGKRKLINFDVMDFIETLEESQKGARRHKDSLEAYSLGFFHGLSGTTTHEIVREKHAISEHMKFYGLMQVARGVCECTYLEEYSFKYAMAIVHVANGSEILLKARIAQEHPLLIFSKIPTQQVVKKEELKFEDLIEHGNTISFSELPERLWATTGFKISDQKLFKSFGEIRNKIIHFSTPEIDFQKLVFEFSFKIIEPLVNEWWDDTLLNYGSTFDETFLEHVFEALKQYHLVTNYIYDQQNDDLKKKN